MIRAVIDTSVWIRYLIRPGASVRTLIEELWVEERFAVVVAPDLMAELSDVLARPRLQRLIQPDDAATLLDAIRARAVMISAVETVPEYTRDRKDDKFVACAIAGFADYLVTTDDDILVLGSLLHTRMVTPYEFVTRLSVTEPEDE